MARVHPAWLEPERLSLPEAGRPGRSAWVEGDVANLGMQIDNVGRVRVAGAP